MLSLGPQLACSLSPLEVLARWPRDRRVAMLHSGRFHPRWARASVIAEPVGYFRFGEDAKGNYRSRWIGPPQGCPVSPPFSHKPFRDLRSALSAAANVAGTGGSGIWIGYLSYDLGRWIERLPNDAVDDRGWPVIELAWCPTFFVHDGQSQRWHACGQAAHELPPSVFTETRDAADASTGAAGDFTAGVPASIFTRPLYEAAIARAIDYVGAGDVFQVNLAQRFTADFRGDFPVAQRALYRRLAAVSPAWYGAYLETAAESADALPRVLCSTSPELFLESHGGQVITRPIKGTRPAGVDPRELLESAKDRAELNMIVDLLRNDLGRVCAYGSIRVDEPRVIESHPTVHHGVATISGQLHPSMDLVDLLRATLPGGSITGAPKVRAMQIIDELEPVRRGPYCGCIGWFTQNDLCLNIAIRTMLLDPVNERVDFSVGGGIVADSSPAGEYDETIDKAQAMLRSLQCEVNPSIAATRSASA